MTTRSIHAFNAQETAELLPFAELVTALANACTQYANGDICAPERQVVPFPLGGVMLSMPATADDIGIHKLVNVVPSNRALNLPTIHGVVSAYDSRTGRALFILDGPTVTARRTAAVSMLGLNVFLPSTPRRIALIGTGTQSVGHIEALAALYPGLRVTVTGTSLEKAQAFVKTQQCLPLQLEATAIPPDDVDAIITLTTSASPVYNKPANAGILVIGVGAFKPELAEIGPITLGGSRIYVDDPAGARHEAGDLIQANVDWSMVQALSSALAEGVNRDRPIVFKTVGCAAWDLAAARCALHMASMRELAI
ncbi:delta(1)-pyrroline-2-carboxylate reductase family protein [Candidimonas sp. SYP-B2681]|uniref:bifunctional Delta(1)-pyrroline-2-carboxylate/Delta(1)-piperideine-2- carboxylate reductase n=1 Tax=Candidimonas sp. SYP-B2681 TaxID=2497686 RepID=UPI000F88B620|nr:bifunctional Delta(1)-pyrroline-2-carboxylate/Delta(1)-piperideine-2-carboxylate reductase [Candidimonas sp. SYP-B2681]RTZ39978.1 delta(1)-pyrroline-2-carboxylate reductase family protein [Candidimonas sp. SYP-B2681]